MKDGRKKWYQGGRWIAVLLAGMLAGTVMLTPVGAHISSFKHLKKHFYTKKAADAAFLNTNEGYTKAEVDARSSQVFFEQQPGLQSVTASADVNRLSGLPAGAYVIVWNARAVHISPASTTRLECFLTAGGTDVGAYYKVRLAANNDPGALIFAQPSMSATASLAAPGDIAVACGSTFGTTIELNNSNLLAVKVASATPK